MSNKQKSNKEKFEKNISKKLKKLYAAGKLNPNTESRLLFVSGKYGFSVIRMEEVPGSGRSFVDSAEMVMNRTVAKALYATNLYISGNIGSIKARMYDGLSLANSYDAKRDVIPPSVDYAKMQGIDLDEAADRQRDNYVDHPDGRKATVTQTNAGHIGLDIKRLYDKAVEERMKLKQELNEAHDKAAEDYKKIEELKKKIEDMTKTINDQYAKNVAIQKLMDGTTAQLNEIKEERDRLQKFYDNAESKDTDVDANEAAEELEMIIDVLSDEDAVEVLAETSNVPEAQLVDTKEDVVDHVIMVHEPFDLPVHKDELPDDYMLTLLQHIRKPYNLRTIFKLQSNIYEAIEPDVYLALIGIRDPRTTNVRNFSRTAYAAAIALSVPEGYVGSFMKRLIDDYKCKDFIPTDPKYLPEDFPNFLKSLYPDIARIHRLLHTTHTNDLPYVYKKERGQLTDYYMIGVRPYDNPSDIKLEDQYVAIPKFANPYDFLEFDKTRELVMVFDQLILKNRRRRPIQFSLDDVESSMNGEDHVRTLKDQINRYIAADEAGLIDLGCNNPDEILKNGLWFYPVIWTYSVEKIPAKDVPTNVPTKISSEPKQDPNEK